MRMTSDRVWDRLPGLSAAGSQTAAASEAVDRPGGLSSVSLALLPFLLAAISVPAQTVETTAVVEKSVEGARRFPGELLPFFKVTLEARVSGFVETVNADRGSAVTAGQTLVRLSAPEIAARVAEAEAKVVDAASRKAEAEAKLAAARSTHTRLKEASRTPGAIAANELILAEQQLQAAEAVVKSIESAALAAAAAVRPLRDLESYLDVKAPFDGVVTERLVHRGALVGPGSAQSGLLRIEQVTRLRLVVSVPETEAAGLVIGGRLRFRVPAHPARAFTAVIARIPRSLDAATRSMPVEADFDNGRGDLAPGMYAEVDWPIRRAAKSLLVPPAAVVATTERTFVIRVSDGKAEWVNVKKGVVSGDLVEVVGALAAGDKIVKRATDEIRNGSPVVVSVNNK
ncbi:MAG: efflux RND transporter periplasmic adaptor subunit [Bryobacterales bacterium]|nr:efflux RND transporter periplasmic adaptor subunit [Bryobacterales bacterium]